MWYIMSYNYYNGFIAGTFQDTGSLFYARTTNDQMEWVELLSEAHAFLTLDEAKEFTRVHWGETIIHSFAYVQFNVKKFGYDREDYARRQKNVYDRLTYRLATDDVEGAELVSMADRIPQDVGLTTREKWIIKILTKDRRYASTEAARSRAQVRPDHSGGHSEEAEDTTKEDHQA